jgi:hypothetical protein
MEGTWDGSINSSLGTRRQTSLKTVAKLSKLKNRKVLCDLFDRVNVAKMFVPSADA